MIADEVEKSESHFLSDLFRSTFVCAATYVYKYVVICHTKGCISGNSLFCIVLLFPRVILTRHTARNLSEAGKAPARQGQRLAPSTLGGKTNLKKYKNTDLASLWGVFIFFLGCISQPHAAVCWWVIPELDIYITPLGCLNFSVCPHRWEGVSQPQTHQSWAKTPKSAASRVGAWLLPPYTCSPLETRSVIPPTWGKMFKGTC